MNTLDLTVYGEAKALIQEGYSPFPMNISRRLEDGTYLCSCGTSGCKGKHPVVKFSEWNGVEMFKRRWENYGIGIHMGKSHCWVLDIDGEAGVKELKELTDKYGALPDTRTVLTGSGGHHYYFAAWVDDVSSGFLSDNIHIKGNIGHSYVVAPPSRHHSGNKYRYLNRRAPVDAPEWLLQLVREKNPHSGTGTPQTDEQLIARMKYEVPIMKLLSKEHYKSLHVEGTTIRGSHPIHGSTTNRNFTIDTKKNRWFCTRHNSHGGLFELAAVLAGIRECGDFCRSEDVISIHPLQGKKFRAAVQYCLDVGISGEDLKSHISGGKYVRR